MVHLAAESHVDKSISGPKRFIETNIVGTFNLLELFKSYIFIFSEKQTKIKNPDCYIGVHFIYMYMLSVAY